MKGRPLNIIFMGTPEFAVPTLNALHLSRHQVVAVVTSVDKLGGRGKKQLLESAVKKYAVEHEIPVLQPKNLKSEKFQAELKSYNADVQVVVAFRMLPIAVWDMPPAGTINLHGSLLPQFRGAAPINWAVITGQEVTGLTTFKLKHEIDTGDMIHQIKVRIEDQETAGDIHDKLMLEGGPLMLKTIDELSNETISYHPQDLSLVSKAPKIFRETCKVTFNKSAVEIHNLIRGLSPLPGSWATLPNGKEIKLLRSEILDLTIEDALQQLKPGEIYTDNKKMFAIGTSDGNIKILEAQVQGKKRMKINDILNGMKFENGTFLT